VASELTLTKQIFGEDLQVLWERSNQELPMGLFYVMHHLGENGMMRVVIVQGFTDLHLYSHAQAHLVSGLLVEWMFSTS